MISVEEAKRVLEEDEKRKQGDRESHRVKDRTLVKPFHFHATVWTFVSKDTNNNMVDATHHEVMGMSPDSCVRKALNRVIDEKQQLAHLSLLTECPDPTHNSRELVD